MDKFERELKETDNPWVERIGKYLLSREDIHENLKKKDKSLKECFDYVLIELSKRASNSNPGVAGDDEEIFGLAVHYYDEDDIEVEKKNFRSNADGSATQQDYRSFAGADKKETKQSESDMNDADVEMKINNAVNKALEDYKKQEQEMAIKKKEERKAKKLAKQQPNKNQLDIFSVLGDDNV